MRRNLTTFVTGDDRGVPLDSRKRFVERAAKPLAVDRIPDPVGSGQWSLGVKALGSHARLLPMLAEARPSRRFRERRGEHHANRLGIAPVTAKIRVHGIERRAPFQDRGLRRGTLLPVASPPEHPSMLGPGFARHDRIDRHRVDPAGREAAAREEIAEVPYEGGAPPGCACPWGAFPEELRLNSMKPDRLAGLSVQLLGELAVDPSQKRLDLDEAAARLDPRRPGPRDVAPVRPLPKCL